MDSLFYILLAVVCACLIFYFGIVVGISDCKRRFNIPKGATEPNQEVIDDDDNT